MKPHQPQEDVTTSKKKSKVKRPDVENTLKNTPANWVRNRQENGQPTSTEELRKQVLVLTPVGEDQRTFTSTAWLENFRQKCLSSNSKSETHENTADVDTSHFDILHDSPMSSNGLSPRAMSPSSDLIHNHDQSRYQKTDLCLIVHLEPTRFLV